jgi:hypothetical protein
MGSLKVAPISVTLECFMTRRVWHISFIALPEESSLIKLNVFGSDSIMTGTMHPTPSTDISKMTLGYSITLVPLTISSVIEL